MPEAPLTREDAGVADIDAAQIPDKLATAAKGAKQPKQRIIRHQGR